MNKRLEAINKIRENVGKLCQCVYQTLDGRRCALGVLMTDEQLERVFSAGESGAGIFRMTLDWLADELRESTGLIREELNQIQVANDHHSVSSLLAVLSALEAVS